MSLSWMRQSKFKISHKSKQRNYTKQVAYELYQNRLLLKRVGDSQGDWKTAEKIVESPWQQILFSSSCLLIKLEKRIWGPILKWAHNQALFGLLGVVGQLGLIIAVVMYIGSEKQRRDAEILNAWQTLTNSYGQSGNGGRIHALEFLNASPRNKKDKYSGANWRRRASCLWICTWQPESLAGLDLSTQPIDITVPDIQSASLKILQSGGNSRRVYLSRVQLPGANLWSANFQGAYLRSANFQDAHLRSANFQGAYLKFINFQGADLGVANLQSVDLGYANLQGAYLRYANLQNSDLGFANLQGAYLVDTNLTEIKGLTQEQLTQAKLCLTKLPSDISLSPNRDCKEMGINPKTEQF